MSGGADINGPVTQVERVSDLRRLVAGVNASGAVLVRCFEEPGDGGGGAFAWVPDVFAADDGATVVVANEIEYDRSGCWRRM